MNDPVLVSVITIVFNGKAHLEQTIHSIINQSYPAIEYIVIDGGSTDGSVEIIQTYQASISFWQSEPDKGIADAMNKALKHAQGEYIVFIHADDYLVDNRIIEKVMQNANGEDIFIGNLIFGRNLKRLTPRGFNFWMNFKTGVYHQAAFCHRRVFERIGGFDTGFKIAMDYDFFLRAYRAGFKVKKIDQVISVMRDTGVSSQTGWPSLNQRFMEERRVHEKNSHGFLHVLYRLYWWLYLPYRKLMSSLA